LARYTFTNKNQDWLVNSIKGANPTAAADGKMFNWNMSLPEYFDGYLRRTEKEKNCKPSIGLSKTVAKEGETIEVSWDCLPDGQEKYWYGLLISGCVPNTSGCNFPAKQWAYGRTGSAQFKIARTGGD